MSSWNRNGSPESPDPPFPPPVQPPPYPYRPEDFPFGGYQPPPDYQPPNYPPNHAPSYPPSYPQYGGYPPAPRLDGFGAISGPGRPASMGNRFLAKFIDAIIVGLPFAVLYVLAMGADNETAETLISLAASVATIGYETWFIANRGATIGKRARGIRVVNEQTGALLTAGKAFQRAFIQTLSNYVLLAGCWSPFLDRPKLRGWHDKIAGDVVITDR